MIRTKSDLKTYLSHDSKNYPNQNNGFLRKIKSSFLVNPISEQGHIWNYIKEMRYVEYYDFKKQNNHIYVIPYLYHLSRLRKESHITGFQIPPHICGKGLTIWHWGSIIINPAVKIGEGCTLYPGVLVGHKKPGDGAAIIGDNVFIGAGTKIIGSIRIGNNVTIGQNCVITKDVPDNSVVVCNNDNRILK